jgi:hypothetical protein
MAQNEIRNLFGMATQFRMTQVVDIAGTIDEQLYPVLRAIRPGGIYENLPLLLIQKANKNGRQFSIAKAIIVSPAYYSDLLVAVGLPFIKQLKDYPLTAEFLAKGNRFLKSFSLLSPIQDRITDFYEIQLSGGVGSVDLGSAYVLATLTSSIAPTATFPATGFVEYPVGDVGKIAEINFVTEPIYKVIRILRTATQPLHGNTGWEHPVYGYMLHPSLAGPLGIPLPPI